MAEECPLRLGDITSTDVKLWLTGSNDQNYEGNPILLHSVILNRSEFFKVKLWLSDEPKEIRITTSHNFDNYFKCIELMYGELVSFSNVEECLAILSVASELLADECINKCMQYLEVVRWNAEQETQIRDVLSSLGLNLLPDLAARLAKTNIDGYTIFVERAINEMVNVMKGPHSEVNRETAERYIAGILQANSCKEEIEVCNRVLSQEIVSSIAYRSFGTMRSLFKIFKYCKGEILRTTFLAFYRDPEIRKYADSKKSEFDENMFCVIISFMQAMGEGQILVVGNIRRCFLTNWLPVMAEFICRQLKYSNLYLAELDKAVVNVVESLPLSDRIHICVEWIGLYSRLHLDFSKPVAFLRDLQDSYHKPTWTQ